MSGLPEMDLKPSTASEPLGNDFIDRVARIETASDIQVTSDADVDAVIKDTSVKKLQRKPHVDRQKRPRVVTPVTQSDAPERKLERNVDETDSDSDEVSICSDTDSTGSTFVANEEPTNTEREEISNALESEKSKSGQTSAKGGASKAQVEGPGIDGGRRARKRKTKDSLKNFFERKIELVEKIVEDRVERFSGKAWEENVERHPWLQPIDTWIADHRKPGSSYTLTTQCQRDGDIGSKPTYKYETIKEDEELQVANETVEEPRETDSPRLSSLEPTNTIVRSKKRKTAPTFRVEYREENVSINVLDDPVDPEGTKELNKRHNNDLLDKIKGNVKEKMEDIHRVAVHADTVFLSVYDIVITADIIARDTRFLSNRLLRNKPG